MKKAVNREKIKFDFKHRLADGSVRDVEAFSKRVEIDGHGRILSIIHDATDRKVAERELQRTVEELKKITLTVINALEVTMNLRDPTPRVTRQG